MFSEREHVSRRDEQYHKPGEVESAVASIVTTLELLQAEELTSFVRTWVGQSMALSCGIAAK